MSDDESVDSMSSGVPAAQNLSSAQISQHPLWIAASGRGGARGGGGRGRGRGRGPPSDLGIGDAPLSRPRFERISLASIEQDAYEHGDGAESTISFSESETLGAGAAGPSARAAKGARAKATKATKKQKRVEKEGAAGAASSSKAAGKQPMAKNGRSGSDSDSDSDSDADDGDADADDDADEASARARRRRLDGMLGSAAFGGGHAAGASDFDDDETAPSEAGSKKEKDATRAAFPVRGLTCVGCALSHRIGVIDKFVNENVASMTEEALYKLAALRYKIDVAQPIEREGGVAPPWGWKQVRSHYELHVTTNSLARHKVVRQLQLLRSQLESRLVRCEGDEREIDRSNADLLLKCITAESRERVLIENAQSGIGKKKDK